MESAIQEADSLGRARLQENDGIARHVEGPKRNEMSNNRRGTQHGNAPLYPGLAGGRLRGCKKKLPVKVTEEFTVSFKAIAGSLVLAFGTDGMWSVLSPLFEELLGMSPSDLRTQYGQVSTLVMAYKGKQSN